MKKNKPTTPLCEKYLWSSTAFEDWVKGQQTKIKSKGFKISTAGVTHKLVNEVLIPNQIDISGSFPKMVYRQKKRRRKTNE